MSSSFASRVLAGGLLLFFFIGGSPAVYAQPSLPTPDPRQSPTSDTATTEWDTNLTGKISVSQAAYRNWQEGGINSLAFTASLDGAVERAGRRWAQAYSMRLALGFIDQEDRRIRKSEDLIRLQADLQYQGDGFFGRFSPTLAGDLRTQFAKGFDYDSNPFKNGDTREPPVQTSAFFAPGTITESLGLTYEPLDQFSVRLGVASKQTIVREPDFRALYGVDEDKLARVEAGGQLSSSLNQRLSENIRYRSQLDIFFAVSQLENPPDAIWQNVVNLEVNDWLSTDLEFVAVYDEDTVRAIQLKEVISVGVSLSVL
ncbi:MAG: DUF3078 domain-containing protein [Salinibacter sp.]|uniref:DUF3078 domain-containing protein n=1 Tax=Salinibacter sp. TaxID=2065818 RepID=UPI0035D3FA5D